MFSPAKPKKFVASPGTSIRGFADRFDRCQDTCSEDHSALLQPRVPHAQAKAKAMAEARGWMAWFWYAREGSRASRAFFLA